MSELNLLSRSEVLSDSRPRARSPLEPALAHADDTLAIDDLSLSTGKLEVRGDVRGLDVDAEVVAITPTRALVVCPVEESAEVSARLRAQGYFVVDRWAALAGVRVRGETLMRRLTDLDLDKLPAAGAVAHVRAVVLRDGDEFRIFFPQEYGHYLAEVVIDAALGLS